jgi:hypothetical protein
MHVLVSNGNVENYPYTIGNLRRDNPNTSFPKKPSDELLENFGMFRVTKVDRPTYDHTKNITEGTPVLTDGVWTQVWNVTDATAEEIAERTEAQAESVRAERDRKLADTDWVTIKALETGESVPTDWATYRQALRDITDHENFPYLEDADWPVKP